MLDILFASAIALTLQSDPAWQVIDLNSDNQRVLTVDVANKAARPRADGIVKARVFVTLVVDDISALTGYWSIDCGRNMHMVSDTVTFDKAGKANERDPNPLPWEATKDGSLFAAVSDYVCKGVTKYPGVVVTGAAPIAAANALLSQ